MSSPNSAVRQRVINFASSPPTTNEMSDTTNTVFNPIFVLETGAKQIISLFIPVSICMFSVVLVARTVPYYTATEVYLIYTPFHTPGADAGTQTWQTIANVLIFLGVVIAMTFLLVCLFKYKCYKCLNGWLIATTFILVFMMSFIFFTEVLRSSFIFFDNITMAILLWNFGTLGIVAIHWHSPLILQQAYLIFNSVQLALIFLKYLPKWTCWVLLGAMAVWDLIAVLCPRGPLRMLVELAHERQRPLLPAMIYSTTAAFIVTVNPEMGEASYPKYFTSKNDSLNTTPEMEENLSKRCSTPILESFPLINVTSEQDPTDMSGGKEQSGVKNVKPKESIKISTTNKEMSNIQVNASINEGDCSRLSIVVNRNNEIHQELPESQVNNNPTNQWANIQSDIMDRRKEGVKLGLGDFIFYSLLIGRAALDGDILTIVTCYVAILVGMCVTIIGLAITERALPALPVSIACGIVFYFTTSIIITPFIKVTSEERIFF